jgi:hypothetical protein
MKSKIIDQRTIAESLQQRCPFITFAFIRGLDPEGRRNSMENLELSVHLEGQTGFFYALEKIIPVMEELVPKTCCEITLLNNVDAQTRYKASNAPCLFIRKGNEEIYHKFVDRASLDYRILRAQFRRKGIFQLD